MNDGLSMESLKNSSGMENESDDAIVDIIRGYMSNRPNATLSEVDAAINSKYPDSSHSEIMQAYEKALREKTGGEGIANADGWSQDKSLSMEALNADIKCRECEETFGSKDEEDQHYRREHK